MEAPRPENAGSGETWLRFPAPALSAQVPRVCSHPPASREGPLASEIKLRDSRNESNPVRSTGGQLRHSPPNARGGRSLGRSDTGRGSAALAPEAMERRK